MLGDFRRHTISGNDLEMQLGETCLFKKQSEKMVDLASNGNWEVDVWKLSNMECN